MIANDLVHLWLSEAWLIALVMAPASIADQIDQKIFVEGLTISKCQPSRFDAGHGIIGIDMHNRDGEALSKIAGVERAATIARIGGKTKLIIGNNMDCAARPVSRQARHIECFGNDALTGERCIPMNDNGQSHTWIESRFASLIG